MAKFRRVLILHGYAGSSAIHWQSWLARKCRRNGIKTYYPRLPDKYFPAADKWLLAIEKLRVKIDSSTAVVCHSIGCAAALNYLSGLKSGKIGNLILVAPATPSRLHGTDLEILLPFFENYNVKKVRRRVEECHVFAADNDQWVSPREARVLATGLNGQFHLVRGGSHLSVPAGFYTFPEIADLLDLK